jgi:hypothetical protein
MEVSPGSPQLELPCHLHLTGRPYRLFCQTREVPQSSSCLLWMLCPWPGHMLRFSTETPATKWRRAERCVSSQDRLGENAVP